MYLTLQLHRFWIIIQKHSLKIFHKLKGLLDMQNKPEPMPKMLSGLNVSWILEYMKHYHPDIDMASLMDRVQAKKNYHIENLKTGHVEPVSIHHAINSEYWYSNIFMIDLYDELEECTGDPDLGYKMGRTSYKAQNVFKTAVGVPLIGHCHLIEKITTENRKYNITKKYDIKENRPGYAHIHLSHFYDVVINKFAVDWLIGVFESYGKLAGATDLSVTHEPIEGKINEWDIYIKYKPPSFLSRLQRIILFNIPIVKSLYEKSEELELKHAEDIINLDKKVKERTRQLSEALKELKEAQSQLVQSAKMASIGSLAAGLAHEINNPAVTFKRGIDQLLAALARRKEIDLDLADAIQSEKDIQTFFDKAFSSGFEGKRMRDAEIREKLDTLLDEMALPLSRHQAKTLLQAGLSSSDLDFLFTNKSDKAQALVDAIVAEYEIGAILYSMKISSERIVTLTNTLKNYAHLDKEPFGEVDVHNGLDDTLIILENALKQGIEIHKAYNAVKKVLGRPNELCQVWTNIIHNAAQALDGRGRIEIRSRDVNNFVQVEITDNGPGMDDGVRDKIFDPFFTTKSQGEGTGLGLTISYGIIKKHGGEITVESVPGKTSVKVTLPAC